MPPLIPLVIVGSLLLAAGVLKLLVPSSEGPEPDPSQACACGQGGGACCCGGC